MTSTDLQYRLADSLREGDLDACEQALASVLAGLRPGPFHCVLELTFTNPPRRIAKTFDRFLAQEGGRHPVRAVYAEMNGFCINPGRWFCDLFAFDRYGGHDDYDWLSSWQSELAEDITLTGLEPLQRVYASPAFRDKAQARACDVTDLLVLVKFETLIRAAAPFMKELHVPCS